MSNRSHCVPNKLSQSYRPSNGVDNQNRCKLPAITNGAATMTNMNASLCRPSSTDARVPQINEDYSSSQANCVPSAPAVYNPCTPSYSNHKPNFSAGAGGVPPRTFGSSPLNSRTCTGMQQLPSNLFAGPGKMTAPSSDMSEYTSAHPATNCSPRPMTSDPNGFTYPPSSINAANRPKSIVRDRHLANEILQKAGISSMLTPNDCLEVITDTPVTMNDAVNCDPNPLCMKKPADCQECYEQSIVFRHLQPPRPPVPPPIIIRERCAQQAPPQPPIVIRQIPPRPCTPPALIIRECPPPMPDIQEPTIIEREVPPPPPPPRQVIVERLPTPPPKPRQIIFEKWLPYEEPEDRPCIVEKAAINEMPPPKNVIIQYEALEPRIQPQCTNEGVSYVDPKQFVNDRPNGNAEVCYVDQLSNLPDHIKCQLSPQTLAAIGIQSGIQQTPTGNQYVVRTNPTAFYQQNSRVACKTIPSAPPGPTMTMNGCPSAKPACFQPCNPPMYQQRQSGNRALSASVTGLSQCYNRYNANMLARPGNQGLTSLARAQYNPWATTYQVSYTNKARGLCRAR